MAHSESDTASLATPAHIPASSSLTAVASSLQPPPPAPSSLSPSSPSSKGDKHQGGGGNGDGGDDDGDPLRTSRFYAFPPSFSLQPNLATRASQLASWSRLVRRYCAWRRQFRLVVADAAAPSSALFHNAAIGRRLTHGEITAVLDFMASPSSSTHPYSTNNTSTVTTGDGGGGHGGAAVAAAEWCSPEKTAAWIYWRRPEEWAELLAGWVEATGQRNVVLTLYELTQGESTATQEFYGMPDELLRKVLQVLVKRGKAQVFGTSGEQGVKFF